jgi:ribosomal protein L5
LAHTNLTQPNFLYTWVSLSLFTLEFGEQMPYKLTLRGESVKKMMTQLTKF